MNDKLHQKAVSNYREAKRSDFGQYDEYETKMFRGVPLSSEEHNFHLSAKDEDYKAQKKIHEEKERIKNWKRENHEF